MTITWEKLEEITGRKKAMLSLVAKTVLEADEGFERGLHVDDALRLIMKLGSFSQSAQAELFELTQRLNEEKAEKLNYAIALEMVKAEGQSLKRQLQELKERANASQRRAERAEARLHEVTQSFAYLIESKLTENALSGLEPKKRLPTLLLTNPVLASG